MGARLGQDILLSLIPYMDVINDWRNSHADPVPTVSKRRMGLMPLRSPGVNLAIGIFQEFNTSGLT